MKYSASQAAKATEKSVPTITRAIKSGRISAEKTDAGGYLIDPAELHRVFPPVTGKGNETPTSLEAETPNETRALQAEIEGLRERIADKDDTISDLRRRLDRETDERLRMTALLTDQRPASAAADASPPLKRGWWPFRRSND